MYNGVFVYEGPNLSLSIGDWETDGWQGRHYHKHVLQNYKKKRF